MQIQSQKSYSPNFKALHIANVGEKSLYKICDTADKKYLKQLASEINIGELMPKLNKEESSRWHEMLRYAIDNAQNPNNITYLETVNNKPCGIITYRLGKNTSILDCICTWPIETGKKVKLAGQTLFYQLFKDFQSSNGKKLKLEAITNGPFDVIKKYEELGFKQTSEVFPTKIIMEINSSKIKETFKKLSQIINYKATEPEKINLSSILN